MQEQNFFQQHKVLILGLLSAILSGLIPYLTIGDVPLPNILYGVFILVLSYLARNLRGQWATILGAIITTLTQAGATELKPGIQWTLLGLNVGIAVIAVFTGPPKSREYEHSTPIVEAKSEAKQLIDEKAALKNSSRRN